jgi:hypothetical protein
VRQDRATELIDTGALAALYHPSSRSVRTNQEIIAVDDRPNRS